MVDVNTVERRAEQIKATAIEVDVTIGNLKISTPTDLENLSTRLEHADIAVPPHCRGKRGVIYALCLQALEWRMPIMAVLNKSYVSVGKGGVQRIAYESQLIHAVVERNAPLKNRLRFEIIGEGDERRCKVWGTFKGEDEPHVYTSETLGKLRDARGRNEEGVLKGSPLWDHQPEVQLFYSASRQWARLYCPDVILGAYTPDDPAWFAIDVTPPAEPQIPALLQRLREAKQTGDKGFDEAHVNREAGRRTVIDGTANPGGDQVEVKHDDEHSAGRHSDIGADTGRDREPDRVDVDNQDAAGRAGTGSGDQELVEASAGRDERTPPQEQVQAEGGGKSKAKPSRPRK